MDFNFYVLEYGEFYMMFLFKSIWTQFPDELVDVITSPIHPPQKGVLTSPLPTLPPILPLPLGRVCPFSSLNRWVLRSGINYLTVIIYHSDTAILDGCMPHPGLRELLFLIHQIWNRQESLHKNLVESFWCV